MGEYDKTLFLAPDSSFIIGAGTCINLGGSAFLYNLSSSPANADANALFMDWKMVGNDMRRSMNSQKSSGNQTIAAAN